MKLVLILLAFLAVSCSEMKTQPGSLAGNWKELAPNAKNQSFWKINDDGSGFLCFKNGAKSTPTKINNPKNTVSTMSGNETLEMDGKILARKGFEKGKAYAHYYVRVSEVPDWCNQLEQYFWEQ